MLVERLTILYNPYFSTSLFVSSRSVNLETTRFSISIGVDTVDILELFLELYLILDRLVFVNFLEVSVC